jgi:hypothetical protein
MILWTKITRGRLSERGLAIAPSILEQCQPFWMRRTAQHSFTPRTAPLSAAAFARRWLLGRVHCQNDIGDPGFLWQGYHCHPCAPPRSRLHFQLLNLLIERRA